MATTFGTDLTAATNRLFSAYAQLDVLMRMTRDFDFHLSLAQTAELEEGYFLNLASFCGPILQATQALIHAQADLTGLLEEMRDMAVNAIDAAPTKRLARRAA